MIEKIKLEGDEQMLIQVRKHWFVITMQLLSVCIMGLFPIALYIGAVTFLASVIDLAPYTAVLIAAYAMWLLIIWMILFNIWTNYYLDVWTITTKRIIAVDQHGFFFRNTASFRLERLQDTQISINGILATLLDYGSIDIHTAHAEESFKAYNLPKPGELKAMILHATDVLNARTAPAEQNKNIGL